jgi:hypothetical protein
MTFDEFLKAVSRQLYVWRMAEGNQNRKMLASRETRLTRTRRRLDDLVLERALTITDERRCAAVSQDDARARCEYQHGHGPVYGRQSRAVGGGLVMHDEKWDHAAPSKGLWWMEKEEHA